MGFDKESDFEKALIELLTHKGWNSQIIKYPTEEDLLKNWANILFENNRGIDRLNDYPLTDGEMQQLVEQIKTARTPLKLNGFINGKTVSITRDNPEDKLHFGKEVSLKIYDRLEIAAGHSRYQIAEQPKFKAKNSILPDRRGDFMLLINGMPVIHVELKKSGIPVSQATNQIEKYAHEGVFTGLFSLVQIFVAMNPEETVYFANPGPEGKFNKDFYFHWADFNNEPINDWKEIADKLLSIPMAHQMIGFYTVADDGDGLVEIIKDYNERYDQSFSLHSGGNSHSYAMMKKDIAARLSHKEPYLMIERSPEKQLDLLIVVDQMLTGFDSKWINTLYMDKVLRYENIIQAFSRTNRIFGDDKPFGTIRYYRYPHTMEKNVERAIKLYSGEKPAGLFVQKLGHNLRKLNEFFRDIKELFENAGVSNFERLPSEKADKGKFVLLFIQMNRYLEAAFIQGFTWKESEYTFYQDEENTDVTVHMEFNETTYLILVKRYKELFGPHVSGGGEDVPYDIAPSLIEIDTGRIDTNYMNSKFENSTVNEILERHCRKLNIPIISVHGLRHTHASLLLFAGVSIGSVARRLGHASMTTTQKTYLHIIHELESQDVDLVMRSISSLS